MKLKFRKTHLIWLIVIISVILTAFPSNYVYYFAPIMVLLTGLLFNVIISLKKFVIVIVIYLGAAFISLSINEFDKIQVNYPGLIFSLITYLPILLFLSKGRFFEINDLSQKKLIKFISIFVIIQSIVVFFQMTQTTNWDALSGTFGLFDYRGRITISQVMFTFNMFVMVLFLLPYFKLWIVKIAILLGFVSVSAAQSGHQTIFFIVTIVMVYLSFRNFKILIQSASVISILAISVLYFFPRTLTLAVSWFNNIVFGNFPKRLVVLEAFNLLKDFKIVSLGTGVGQFSSRASLFSSGEYLGVSLPSIITGKSHFYEQIMVPLIELQQMVGQGSAIAKPYFSILSIILEFGIPISILIMILLLKEIYNNYKGSKLKFKEINMLYKFKNASLIFFLLSSFIENYAEFVQAIFLPILIYYMVEGRIGYLQKKHLPV
jgi:hypothetical protein